MLRTISKFRGSDLALALSAVQPLSGKPSGSQVYHL